MPILTRNVAWRRFTPALSALRIDRDFQPRQEGLNHEQVERYAVAMHGGSDFPSIKVAQIGKLLYVVDGFHRIAAAKRLRLPTIAAEVARLSRREALAVALDANSVNGLPFNRKDRQRIFSRFCEEGLHIDAQGVCKSLRAIREELRGPLGIYLSPTTVSTWLRKFAPATLSPEEEDFESDHETPKEERQRMSQLEEATRLIDDVVGAYSCLDGGPYRSLLRDHLQEALVALDRIDAGSDQSPLVI